MTLTKAERTQISQLHCGLDGKPITTGPEFLHVFRNGHFDRTTLVRELLGDALASKDTDEVELAMLVGFSIGFSESDINILASLAQVDWHFSHEDIASALDEIRSPRGVNTLRFLAHWVPAYLEFDDARALGIKSVWGLSKIGDSSAKQALEEIAKSQNDLVGKLAQEKLFELG